MTRKLNAIYRPPTAVAYTANGHTFWMIPIPKGGFWMGEGEDKHRIELAHDYALGQFPVTQALWRAVMGKNPSHFEGSVRPMERVSWNDAQEFLDGLNALPDIAARNADDGQRFQLPTEAQWEYAARGGRYEAAFAYKYAGSAHLPEVGWYHGNSQQETQLVGRKRPNALGLYDMSGNLCEWCEDDWNLNYRTLPNDGRAWINKQRWVYRVGRGGSWNDNSKNCSVKLRNAWLTGDINKALGFRLARYKGQLGNTRGRVSDQGSRIQNISTFFKL